MHYAPLNLSDKIALFFTKSMRFFADTFFKKRYGHRAVVLETVAGVPGMVAGMWNHLISLRKMQVGYGPKIRTLLAEAENERMHLMTFIAVAQPNAFERMLVLIAQAIFWNFFFLIYVFFPRTAHRIVGYFEEEAVYSYTEYLKEIDEGRTPNIPAPKSRLIIEPFSKCNSSRCSHCCPCWWGQAPRCKSWIRLWVRSIDLNERGKVGP